MKIKDFFNLSKIRDDHDKCGLKKAVLDFMIGLVQKDYKRFSVSLCLILQAKD